MTTPPPRRMDEHEEPPRWDDPMTRLMLLLEIADEPAWMRDVGPTSSRPGGARPTEG